MRKLLITMLCLCLGCIAAFSQTQTLQVIYITKDYTTEVNPLCQDLRDIYSFAEKDKSQAVVFYLANAASPLIVKVNLPGDNRKDFDSIIDALMTKSETIINASTDLHDLVSLFDEIELLDSDGQPAFQSAELIYYITPTFWELNYNEQLIAAAYFALDMDADWAKNYFSMSIYHNATDGLVVDERFPFGEKDLCGDYKFFLLTYSH